MCMKVGIRAVVCVAQNTKLIYYTISVTVPMIVLNNSQSTCLG